MIILWTGLKEQGSISAENKSAELQRLGYKFWLRVELAIIQGKLHIGAEELVNTLLAQISCPCIFYEKASHGLHFTIILRLY